MFNFLYLWADIIWLPIILFTVHKAHRWWSVGFVISSMILVRLLAEIMVYIGHENGIMGFVTANVHTRALLVSSFFYIIFIIVAHYSTGTRGVVFMAGCLTFFFAIFVTCSLVMVL